VGCRTRVREDPPMDHDHAYKRLFAGPERRADLLRELICEP
jgi:hypothetical protein